jgi:uncharacterized protein with NAD-binding domain and iron-sulfur cluster
LEVLTRFPTDFRDVADTIKLVVRRDVDLPPQDLLSWGHLLLVLLTSSRERRFQEYEQVSWWQFVQADRRSAQFRRYFCDVAVQSLVAMSPRLASARTTGVISAQLWTAHGRPGTQVDRLLNGPTHDVWLTPWRAHLQQLGVEFRLQTRATRLSLRDRRVSGVRVERPGGAYDVEADFHVAAVPVERMAPLVSPAMKEADPSLAHLGWLHTEWMNGVQFFLGEEVPIVHGHLALIDAPWALTAIAQKQFWPDTDLAGFGDGRVRDVLSVIVSDWDAPGTFVRKPARLCSREEIRVEVWQQLKAHVNGHGGGGRPVLRDAALVDWYLAESIEHRADGTVVNHEPLLINTAGSWRYRPEAVTRIPNLFLAADYVRTHTDIASMEAANEAARRAVNGILAASGVAAPACRIWDLEEPAVFKPLQLLDRRRLERGLPHLLAAPAA